MTFRAEDKEKVLQLGVLLFKTTEGDVVGNQVENQGRTKWSMLEMVGIEPVGTHLFRQEVRRLFGIKNADDQIARQWGTFDGLGHAQHQRDRGSVVVGTRGVDHTVIVRANQKRRQSRP